MAEDNNKDNLGDDLKNAANETANEAKETVHEVKEGWNQTTQGTDNKKMLAGLLAILLGIFGVHKFILGYNKEGIIMLSIFLISIPLTCIVIGAFTMYIPAIIGLIEGIIYLTKSDEEFYQTYQLGKKPWF